MNKVYELIEENISYWNNQFEEFDCWYQNDSEKLQQYYDHLNVVIDETNKLNVKCNIKGDINLLHGQLKELNKELNSLKSELCTLESNYNLLKKQFENSEQECIKTKKKIEVSSADKTIIDLAKKKLEVFSNMTNIRWDYSIPLHSNIVSGYTKNKNKNYIHAFELKKNEIPYDELSEKVWKEIEMSSEIWMDIVNMTDIEVKQ